MSEGSWNREAAERAERDARVAQGSNWLKPAPVRKPKSLIARMIGFLLGRKS